MNNSHIQSGNQSITESQAKRLIMTSNGRLFSTTFFKKNGDSRDMTARIGVKNHLHGGHSSTLRIKKYIDVFDMHAVGYRKINMDTMTRLKINGITYTVTH